jgi:hypothetical protein
MHIHTYASTCVYVCVLAAQQTLVRRNMAQDVLRDAVREYVSTDQGEEFEQLSALLQQLKLDAQNTSALWYTPYHPTPMFAANCVSKHFTTYHSMLSQDNPSRGCCNEGPIC